MAIRVKSLVATSVILIGGLVAASSAQAQYVPSYWNPGPFPPRSSGWYVTSYPYAWPWYGSYARSYGWNRGYRFGGYRYHSGYRYHYGYLHYGSGHVGQRVGLSGHR